MYSRFNDPRRPARAPTGVPPRMPSGVPSYRQKVHVPPGYKGNAIVDGEERSMGEVSPPDASGELSPSDVHPDNRDFGYEAAAEPHFEGLEQVSDLPNRDKRPMPLSHESQRTGGLFDLSHFPFGHGIGTEEWLLIGLIFLLLREAESDRGDLDETVLLLGLLLLGG